MRCFACDEPTHVVKNCPKLHANLSKERYLKNNRLNEKRLIKTTTRKRNLKFKALQNIYEVKEASKIFRKYIEFYIMTKKIKNIPLNMVDSFNESYGEGEENISISMSDEYSPKKVRKMFTLAKNIIKIPFQFKNSHQRIHTFGEIKVII